MVKIVNGMYKENGKPKRSMAEVITGYRVSSDFVQFEHNAKEVKFWISYIRTVIDPQILHDSILAPLLKEKWNTNQQLKEIIPIEDIIVTIDTDIVSEKLLDGYVIISFSEYGSPCALIRATLNRGRDISLPEVEFSVVGPKEAFVEAIEFNINLIRKRIQVPTLKVKELKIGDLSKTKIAVLYIEDIANEENVNTFIQRLKDIHFDQIGDSGYIAQFISDNHNSPFPQVLDSERPDRVAAVLSEGKVAVVVDGSPQVLIGPTTLVEFFSSYEDYYLNWVLSSFFRLIRVFAVAFSILVTPVYVATLTFHYELIPRDLLNTLVTSRREIPLPPILEALVLELTIELLREAGARLPTKVGQTIGIVGGIVIGTASVEAGLTSNVLLIIVALAALASFTTPVYKMGNTIRLLRFPFLIFAQIYGLLGIVLCFCFLAAHLLRLTSMGRPFLEPIYPPRSTDLKDSLIRIPFSTLSKRPMALRTKKPEKFSAERAKQKHDIDE